jgi:glutathione-regulated potassium-efflux system ancillary protein KefC
MHGNVLAQAFVYLAAAVLVVPIAKRLGLGSVLGYLLAGVALGPFALGLVGREGQDVMHFAEFGVVMMLFLVGLELRPSVLWQLRRPILGLGGAQVAITAAAILAVALAAGQSWRVGLTLGVVLAGSSTAIVLQSLAEKGLLRSPGGQAAFSVLLCQDLAVIPILAILPLLSTVALATPAAGTRPGWQQALLVLGAVAGIIAAGRFLVSPLFRFLARTRLREIFSAAALALVIGITLLMQAVGLSPALGTFLAGVVLAESEYRHELEADIEPFKGLLLGVFFIAVGASIDFRAVADRPGLILALVSGIMVIKALVLLGLGRLFRLPRQDQLLLALSLAQAGEFAFVLFEFAVQQRVLSRAFVAPLVAVVALTMLLTPLVLLAFERLLLPRLAVAAGPPPEPDPVVAREGSVVIAGFGRFGQIVGRLLRASGVPTTVLDLDPDIVGVVRRVGLEVHYGDASRLDLLHAAGCERARLFVLAVDDPAKALDIGHMVRKHFPHLPILARARGRQQYYELVRLQPLAIVRETLGSALELGERALRALGFRAHEAHRLARSFQRHDEAAVQSLAPLFGRDEKAFFAAARQALEETERLLRDETGRKFGDDHAWDNESLRSDAGSRG